MNKGPNDLQVRYTALIREMYDYSVTEIPVPIETLRNKYGVTWNIFTFLTKQKGLFTHRRTKDGVMWTTRYSYTPTDEDCKNLLDEYRIWNSKQKEAVDPTLLTPTPKKESCLTAATTQELIEEIKRRGYSGTLVIKKEIHI
jgi:hypothetical protein